MPNIIVGQTLSTTWSRTGAGSGGPDANTYTFKLDVTLLDQSETDNTSSVRASLSIAAGYTGLAWAGGTATFSLSKAANGSGYSNVGSISNNSYSVSTSYKELLSRDFTINHNADGTCSFSIKGVNTRSGNSYIPRDGSGEITSIVPPTIPRAASLSVTPSVIGKSDNMRVVVTPPNDTFKTTTTYKVGSTTVTLGSNVTGNRTYTVPYTTLASYIGSFTSGEVEVICQTYNDTTLIGTTTAKVTVQTGVIPLSWVDDRNGHVGVTVGQKAAKTDYDFRVYLDSKFTIGDTAVHEALRDYVIEEGTSGDWTYRKWASGISECWGKIIRSVTGAAWKSPHSTVFEFGQFTYPSGLFVAAPIITADVVSNWWMAFMVTSDTATPATKDTTPSVTGVRPSSDADGENVDAEIHIYAKGRWK